MPLTPFHLGPALLVGLLLSRTTSQRPVACRLPANWFLTADFDHQSKTGGKVLIFSVLDFPAFLVANVIIDVEPFLVLVLGLDYRLHGFFHSFVGGSIVAVFLANAMTRAGDGIQSFMSFLKLKQKGLKKGVWLASFLGVYLHILLDSLLYTDITPFYPLTVNPFYRIILGTLGVYSLCALSFIVGIGLYSYKVLKH